MDRYRKGLVKVRWRAAMMRQPWAREIMQRAVKQIEREWFKLSPQQRSAITRKIGAGVVS